MFYNALRKGEFFNPDEKRARKLLLHRYEIDKIIGKIREKGFTLVPTKVYFKGNKVKVEIALAKVNTLTTRGRPLKKGNL